ncbi:MAG TPA: hypothetical protein VGL09_14950 [Methylomirabilota bacterium]|jgi:hypothetical protein
MNPANRVHGGAAALATSAVLLAVFPIVRPFFPLDVFSPTLADVASGPLASPWWLVAHLMLLAGFALLPVGLLAVHATLVGTAGESRARRGVMLSVIGLGLVQPMVGVETFTMPLVGRLYLDGVSGVAPALAETYRGPGTLVMLLGLLLLAIGAIDCARAIAASRRLPPWGGIALAVGLASWLPLLPRPIRIIDGLLIGFGGLWLAWATWRHADASPVVPAPGEQPPRDPRTPSRLEPEVADDLLRAVINRARDVALEQRGVVLFPAVERRLVRAGPATPLSPYNCAVVHTHETDVEHVLELRARGKRGSVLMQAPVVRAHDEHVSRTSDLPEHGEVSGVIDDTVDIHDSHARVLREPGAETRSERDRRILEPVIARPLRPPLHRPCLGRRRGEPTQHQRKGRRPYLEVRGSGARDVEGFAFANVVCKVGA